MEKYSLSCSLILLLTFLFLASCDLFNNDTEIHTGELMPLSVGNYWVYETTYLGELKDTIRYEVTAEVDVPYGDTTYTAYAANFVPFTPDFEPYYWLRRNGVEGLYFMGGISGTDTLFLNDVEYKFPSEVDETILTPQVSFSFDRFEFYLSITLSITLVDDAYEINTPAGKFECLVYKFTLSQGEDVIRGLDYYMYYSPGTGLVAQIATTEGMPENIQEEMYLIEYQIN